MRCSLICSRRSGGRPSVPADVIATVMALTDKALDSTVLSATSITDVLVQPLTDKPPSAKELQLQQQAVFRDPASRARMEAGIYQSRGLSIVVTEISPDTPEELEKLRSWYASELERRQVSTTIPFGPLDRRILVDLEFEMNASGFAHKE